MLSGNELKQTLTRGWGWTCCHISKAREEWIKLRNDAVIKQYGLQESPKKEWHVPAVTRALVKTTPTVTHHISLQKRNFVFHILICHGAVIYIKDEGKEKYKIFSPLDCKEIRPVHPKGNQSYGRTDAEAETPIVWPPDVKN